MYAEPIKSSTAQGKASTSSSGSNGNVSQVNLDEYDEVQLRPKPCERSEESVTYENTSEIFNNDNTIEKTRHSDSKVNEYMNRDETDNPRPAQRKFHSKSFSLSENRVAANLNLFQQNRELWEKRTEMQSQQCLTAPRILTRNRIAPDLVMDLPVSNSNRAVHSSHESLNSSDETSEKTTGEIKLNEDMTTAERFATQNQCTLKKNERFSGNASSNEHCADTPKEIKIQELKAGTSNISVNGSQEKPKAEVKPQESTLLKEFPFIVATKTIDANDESIQLASTSQVSSKEAIPKTTITATAVTIAPNKDLPHKSPIPTRNTQKFVSQFADLHLTGGCLSTSSNTTPISTITDSLNSQQQQTLTSFKPQIKVKPQMLRKPLVLPPTTPEMARRSQD